MQPVAVSWQSAVQCDWTTKTPTGQCLLLTKQRLAASVYSPLTLGLLHAANVYDRWSVLMRSSWMISHVPSGWVMRKYSSDRRFNPAWFIKTSYVCTSLRQCACWYSMQMFLVSKTSVFEEFFCLDALLRPLGNSRHLIWSHSFQSNLFVCPMVEVPIAGPQLDWFDEGWFLHSIRIKQVGLVSTRDGFTSAPLSLVLSPCVVRQRTGIDQQ